MATTIDNTTDLTGFKALSFDCYGTLIDWETSMAKNLQPLLSQLPADHPFTKNPSQAVQRFSAISYALEASQPTLRYDKNVVQAFHDLAKDLNVACPEDAAQAMSTAPGTWPPFSDTLEALAVLQRHYKLIILSNIDEAAIRTTTRDQLRTAFDAVYTAEAIGSYKPTRANFEYLFAHAAADLGVDATRGDLLHVARSLTSDHVPARQLGLPSCWICRGGDRPDGYGVGGNYQDLAAAGKVGFTWKFDTLGDLAAEVERQFAARKS